MLPDSKAIKSKRGRPKGMRLTATDLLVLRKVGREGFQTYPELRSDVLSSYNRTHSWDLLRRLSLADYLIPSAGDFGAIRGWGLSQKGRELLSKQTTPLDHLDSKAPNYRTAFDHDLMLREIRKLLSQSPCISKWIPEHVLKAQAMAKINFHHLRDRGTQLLKVPDALFKIKTQGGRFNAALELEVTRKTKKRIFQKLEFHVTEPAYDFIFFVVKDEPLRQFLWEIYQSVLVESPRVKVTRQRNGIYFACLEDVRALKLEVPWTGEKDTLILANLVPEIQNITSDKVG